MSYLTLALETVSLSPSFSLFQDKQLLYTRDLSDIIDLAGRLDLAIFPDILYQSLLNHGLQWKDIDNLYFCAGTGAFSGIRVSIIIARILYRLSPNLICYKYSLAQLLYYHHTQALSDMTIAIPLGIKGYYIQTFNQGGDIENTLIMKELPANHQYTIYNKNQSMNLSIIMPDIPYGELVEELDAIMPEYIREPNITQAKITPSKNI